MLYALTIQKSHNILAMRPKTYQAKPFILTFKTPVEAAILHKKINQTHFKVQFSHSQLSIKIEKDEPNYHFLLDDHVTKINEDIIINSARLQGHDIFITKEIKIDATEEVILNGNLYYVTDTN